MRGTMQEKRPAGSRWKISLLVLIGVFIGSTAASMIFAARRVSRVVDADYYRHGIHYGETHDRPGEAGRAWRMAASLTAGEFEVHVRDGAGAPVAGGHVTCDLVLGRPAQHVSLLLAEAGPGVYRAPCPAALRGEGYGTMRCTRGDTVVSGKVVVIN